jgi:sugar lactone lactonase YvrE
VGDPSAPLTPDQEIADSGAADLPMAARGDQGMKRPVSTRAGGGLPRYDWGEMRRIVLLFTCAAISGAVAQISRREATHPVGDSGPAIEAQINGPRGIAIDGSKFLYIIEGVGDFIRRVDLTTGIISTVKPKAKLDALDSIVVDAAGDLIVTEFTMDRVQKVNPRNGSVILVAGRGRMGFSGDGGPAQAAYLSWPRGLALDLSGNLYIVDMSNNRVRRVDAQTGTISTVVGGGKRDSTGDGGPALSAGLEYPSGIAIDRLGNIYISQYGYGDDSHRIRRVDARTRMIETFAGLGKAGLRGDSGPALTASLQMPSELQFDPQGNLFVVDPVNDRVRRVDAESGIITTFAGTTKGFDGDGKPATRAQLNNPSSIAFDAEGNLYIAEFVNNRVRRVDAKTGIITTVAGNGLPHRIDILM